ncbi:MAG: type II secretion system protein GspG [Kiritimatiellae bacterium]|nr:type II secretion system protein GspG [Kiritimatiellia bacterium]
MRKEETVAVSAMRAGFTLIEILVAVAIIGILGTTAAIGIPRILENSKIKAAKVGVDNLKAAVVAYNIEKGKYPGDLKVLVEASGDDEPIVEGGEGALYDPWGTEYKYEKKGKRFVVISAGPDGEFGGDDDIRSDVTKRSTGND